MPTSVAIAVAADVAATAIADAIIFDLVAATTLDWVASYAVIQTASSFIAGAALRGAIGSGAEAQSSPGFVAQAQARAQVIRSSVANRQIIYGEAVVGGPLVFVATSPDSNNFLHLVIALADHECESIEAVYFNGEEVGAQDSGGVVIEGAYTGHAAIFKHLGGAGQVASPELVTNGQGWTSNHIGAGVCYLHIMLVWNLDIYPRGIPSIKARVRGKKLYDPRTGLTVWSQNWALACRDYLTAASGLRCTDAEVDDTSFIAAANIADESVALAAGGSEARYTVNCVFDTGQTPKAIMQALLSGGAGTLTWPSGVYTLAAGAYDVPAVSLDEDDLRGPVHVRARVARQDLFNAVKGTFVNPDQYWQPVDFPPVTNATYETQDGGQRLWRDVAYPVTTSSATAQRLAKIALEKSRQGITVEMPCKLTAFKLRVWDTVALSLSHLGWSGKVFRITGWRFSESGGVDLTLQEEASACYTWSAEETIADPAPDTSLPDPLTVSAPAGVVLSSGTAELLLQADGTVVSRIRVEWTVPTDGFIDSVEVQSRRSGYDWGSSGRHDASTGFLHIMDVADGESYDVRLRYRNTLGVSSAWTQAAPHVVVGKTALPPPVSRFSVIEQPGGVRTFFWTLNDAPLDLMSFVVRWSPGTTQRPWAQMAPLFAGVREARQHSTQEPVGDGDYVFAIKPVDTTGNASGGAVYASATFDADSLGTLAASEFAHQSGWPGTVAGGYIDANALVDAGALTWNDLAAVSWDDLAATPWSNTPGTIEYTTQVLDAAAVASHAYRVSSVESGTTAYEVRSSNDNVTWSSWGATSATPITARYFQFRFSTTGTDPVLYRASALVYA